MLVTLQHHATRDVNAIPIPPGVEPLCTLLTQPVWVGMTPDCIWPVPQSFDSKAFLGMLYLSVVTFARV